MSEEQPYVPLADRVKQDVWHDNFVPKYSAIASASPTKLLLTGVWLIFAPAALMCALFIFGTLYSERDTENLMLLLIYPVFGLGISSLILFTQTRRFLNHRSSSET